MNAEEIKIECEEDGFYLWFRFDEGDLAIRIQDIDLDAFYDQVKTRLGPYLRERDAAKVSYIRDFHCDPDESGGYDVSDPKSDDYHDRMSAIYDNREGK